MKKTRRIPRSRKWSSDLILAAIKKLDELSPKLVQKSQPSLYGAAIRYFGSWRSAVEASGLPYKTKRRGKEPGYWTSESIMAAIAKLTKLNSNYVRQHHADLYSAALRVFGSWRFALEACGLDYEKIKKK